MSTQNAAKMASLCLLLLISSPILASLSFVKNKQSKRFGSSEIEYTLAPFGKLPYGRELFGKLSFDFKKGCSPFHLNGNNSSSDIPHMLMLNVAPCNIKIQSLNAENAGAKLLIIIVPEAQSEKEVIDKARSSSFIKVKIPTLLVTLNTGKRLREVMDQEGELYLKFVLPVPQRDKVDLEVWLDKTTMGIWNFVAGFKSYYTQFGNKVEMKLRIFAGDSADDDAKLEMALNCLEDGQIFEVVPEFINNCVKAKKVTASCLDKQVQTFDSSLIQDYKRCKKLWSGSLSKVKATQVSETSGQSPYVSINGIVYHGALRPVNIFEAVCAGFMVSPGNCLYLNNKYVLDKEFQTRNNQKKQHKAMMIIASLLITMLLLSVVGFLLCVIYNKSYQRTLQDRVADMVKDSVVQYQSMKDNV